MSDKIQVAGKMCVAWNVYDIRDNKGNRWYGLLSDDHVMYDADNALICSVDEVIEVKPINGEVLEDVPSWPKRADTCVFSNHKDFYNWHVAEYFRFDGKHHFTNSNTSFVYCKLFDPTDPPWSKS